MTEPEPDINVGRIAQKFAPQRPTVPSLASAFGAETAERVHQLITRARELGGQPHETFARQTSISNSIDRLAPPKTDPQRREAARRVAKAAVLLFDTTDPLELLASLIFELHNVAFALGLSPGTDETETQHQDGEPI